MHSYSRNTIDRSNGSMTSRRIRGVNTLIAFLVVLSLLAILFRKELWPFSPYTMYSHPPAPGSVEIYRLFGVTGTTGREIALEGMHLKPFDVQNLGAILKKLERKNGYGALVEGVSDCLRRYEQLRRIGCHEGPPIRALRLYRLGLNADVTPTRELLAEVHHQTG